ncbi:intradiol ring-cleavage dioxygenase [Roseomonas hellenica]|uniref:Intradiol ring-cleavage dioxygenase n=1 Tax=Plastoroseomonas hellenica TaxID=2687306 RepID=A0ABS5ES08_9PROT|nr:intradiol ring-cleavage dioxygenase [Plastoroseomonas hellenica]MBR0663082.1 intradiol ring-cleavage dioxygenase [Plastoroseomonas hellenica]
MRNFSEETITGAVLARLVDAPSPRARAVSEALIRHLHAFVREVRPTQAEWADGIAFLTCAGQMCSDTRQEFILLSDTLGVSMLVDAINHPLPDGATETTVLGPFYVEGPPELALGEDIAGGKPGEKLLVEGTVRGPDGTPIAGAWIDTWHSDTEGFYDVQLGEGLPALNMRARFRTDAEGRFWFRSVVPSCYPVPHDGPVGDMLKAQGRHPYRPAHVHFMIGAPGCETLVTHVFLDGDPYLDSDVVFGVKDSLVRALSRQEPGTTPGGNTADQACALLRYDFVLAPGRA